MVRLRPSAFLAASWLCAFAAAQQPAPASAAPQDLDALCAKTETMVVEALLKRADALDACLQHGRAVALRRLVLEVWEPGNARALTALGFVEVAGAWRRDANKLVPEMDQKGDAKAIKKADQEWVRVEKDVLKAIASTAKALDEAGDRNRAVRFHKRYLALRPGDKHATAAIAASSFDGFAGSPVELAMLKRGRAFAQGVEFLRAWTPPSESVKVEHPLLQKAGIPCQVLRTRHFTVWGVVPPERLKLAAETAERAWLLSRMLFAGAGGRIFEPRRRSDIVWTNDRATFTKVLEACKEHFTPERLRFLQNDVELAFLPVGSEHHRLYTVANSLGDDYVRDVTARGVVQDASGIELDGLWEGIGHTAVGVLFDRTLSFFVEQPSGNTVTSWKPVPLLPEMAAWRKIAAESAWAKNDTPTARLVLLKGDKLTNEERVKAWSMCDWLLRTDPTLLLHLAASKTDATRDPDAVAASFAKLAGTSTQELDERWRTYWGTGDEVRKAMKQAPQGDAKAVAEAKAFAHALFAARADADVPPAGFVLANSADAQSVHAWFVARKKHADELKRLKAMPKPGPLPEPPPKPEAAGKSIAFFEGTDPALAVAHWLVDPRLRDVLLDPGRSIYALARGPHAFVLELDGESQSLSSGAPICWPADGQRAVAPSDEANGTGMPLSLHFHRPVDDGDLTAVTATVTAGGEPQVGHLVTLHGASGASTKSCVVFVPRSPLPSGEVEIVWKVPVRLLGGKDVPQPRARFTVR